MFVRIGEHLLKAWMVYEIVMDGLEYLLIQSLTSSLPSTRFPHLQNSPPLVRS